MTIRSETRDKLFWCAGVLWVLGLLIAFAGWGLVPPSLEATARYKVIPTKVYQVQTKSLRTGKTGDPYSYVLEGVDSANNKKSFFLPVTAEKLSLMQRITVDTNLRTEVEVWVELNQFADVIQMKQGDRMVLSYADAVESRWKNAKERFLQAALAIAGGAALFLAVRKFSTQN